ncbi:MAG: response regulator [Pyrinomonadaceae bacterium]|nr:response regulator [Pyrinomonadaceae bacterium]MCX7639785.1 response regulator [Pyrinomonadaceae bacterium]MDW8304368.1 response regulator [Acidobacteriota bacterium]
MNVEKEKPKVLVADDDPAILRLMKAVLEREGFLVVTARDGRDAYKILQEEDSLQGAILDVIMPYIQGTELVRYMKTDDRLKNIPVIVMTAEQNPRLSAESINAGAVAFLPKPFTTVQLQEILRKFFVKSRSI